MAISSIGVGSGLPLDELLNDLRKAENQTLTLIQGRQNKEESRLSGYAKVKSALDTLQTAAEKLGESKLFGTLKGSVSSDAISISANNKAIAGKYDIDVTALATNQRLQLNNIDRQGKLDGTAGEFLEGKLRITLENGDEHEIDLSSYKNNIDGLVKAINDHPQLGVNATLLNTGNGDKPHSLFITATSTGTDAGVAKFEFDGNVALNDQFGFDKNNSTGTGIFSETEAQNAAFNINGLAFSSQSNTVEDAIEGVTLTLNKTTESQNSITLSRDDGAAKKAIQDFVSSYNALQSTIKVQTHYDMENQKGGPLTGDGLARRAQNDARDALNVFISGNEHFALSEIGLTTDVTTGELKLDESKLDEALKNNVNSVSRLLSGENGLSQRVTEVTKNYLEKDGYLANATEGVNESIDRIKEQFLAAQTRIDNKMEQYRKQFQRLDVMVNQMQGISNYLTQQLSMLGNMNQSNK